MSGQQIGAVVGGAIGAFFGAGNPAAIQLGMAIGGTLGGIVDPTKVKGPKIGDGQQQSATDGNPIAWVQGTAMVAGTIVQVSPRRQKRHKDSGKGGTTQVTYTASQDFAILVCESCELRDSTMSSILMVFQDGKLVYDVRPGSTILDDSAKWKANVDFLFGDEEQLPHPTLEAITGVGNTPAYRGSCIAVFKDFNVTAAGDRIPSFQFVVASGVGLTPVGNDGSGAAFPKNYTVSVPSAPGLYALYFATGQVPDKFEVWDGGDMLVTTGYHGDAPTQQAALNAALDSYHAPHESIVQYPYPPGTSGVTIDEQWDDPKTREVMLFYKTSDATSLTVRNYSPISGTGWRIAIAPASATPSLASIVSAVALRGGLTVSDTDVSMLAGQQVLGYPIATQATAADCLLPLLQAYFAYATEYDSQLHFKFYGEDASVVIDRADLIEGDDANDGAITSNLRNQSTEFPRRVVGSYMDPAQNYSVVNVPAERRAIDVQAIGDQSFSIPVVMDADTAQQAVDKALKVAYATLEGTLEYATPFAGSDVYIGLAAGEPLQFQGKRYVADEMILSNGSIKWTTRYDRQSAYRSSVQAILGNAPTPPASPYSGPTTLIPMNLPSLRPQDTYGVYLAAAGANGQASWTGCTVQVSYDNQATWQNVTQIREASTFGALTTNEPSGGEPLTAQMNGDLESATADQIAANANAFALLHAAGTELGQFTTATETSTAQEYELTGITRGQLGTTQVAGVTGDRLVMLDAVYFLPIDISFGGKTLYFRGVGNGETAEDSDIIAFVYQPDTTVIHDGGVVTP